jgi:Transposase DDE domain
VRRLNRQRMPEHRLPLRKPSSLARDRLEGLQQLLPAGFQVYVLFDSWYASNGLLTCCRRQGWHVICAIKSNRKLDDKKLSQWPQALRHQRYQRVQLTATDQRLRTYLVRTLRGKRSTWPCEVCVLIRQRHHRDQHPKYFLCTDLALTAPHILPISQKRWPMDVDNFYVKQPLGLADFRVQSYEATEKWCAMVLLALVFLQWRLNHASSKERLCSLADVVRHQRDEHARTFVEAVCQEAVQRTDYLPVLQRFLCQPT